jgi:hypothetical protein
MGQETQDNGDFIFLVDNLRMGGIQRLLIDECYWLIENGITTTIVTFSDRVEFDEIIKLDREFPYVKDLDIQFAGTRKIQQIQFIANLLKSRNQSRTIVSHTTRGAFVGRIAIMLSRRPVLISLYIHQVSTLSDRKQRIKRMVQALFAHHLYASAMQFKLSWEEEIKGSRIWKRIFTKEIHFDRIGVYLPRLQWQGWEKEVPCISDVPHLVFMSRITTWKGFSNFTSICENNVGNNRHAIVITTRNGRKEIFDPEVFKDDYQHVIFESGPATVQFSKGSIHMYPTNYGAATQFPQSIGLNVLELLALGVPSMISKEGLESWPELASSPMVRICDWESADEVIRLIREIESLTEAEIKNEVLRITPSISIETHGMKLLAMIR